MRFNDEELIVMFASGMNEAFDMLYERHRHSIYRFALACLRNTADAEDVVQEVFLRVSRAAARYQPRGRFKSWLFQIAANRIRTLATSHRKGVEKEVDGPENVSIATAENIERSVLLQDLILKSMSRLTENQRMVLLLKEVEGLSCQSIAQSLDLSHENVRVLIHRARKQILSFIRQEQGEYVNG